MANKTIGIDIREANGEGAGKGIYTEEITHALIRQAPNLKFFLFTKEANSRFENTENVQQVVINGKGLAWHFKLKQFLNQHPVDLFLATTSYIYPAIAPKDQKIAMVVHDLIAFRHPEHNHWFSTMLEKFTLGRALKNTNLVVTVSSHTWRDLVLFKPEAQKIPRVVAYPAVNKDIRSTSQRRMDLPDRFLLAVGTLQPRKNIQGVIKAFEKVAEAKPQLHLCIAGGKGWKSSAIFEAIPEWLKERIHFLGYVRHDELIELYSRAQMLVFPSFYEGFGIPPLEAMACGCPVITSDLSSLPEVVGSAALMVNPDDTDEIADAINQLLGPQMQSVAQERGLKQVSEFSWDESASGILNQVLKLTNHRT
ncbi:MAG: glycosyltransferase involved in cell wall biosynthesis [Oceanicoccus sp.]|jgi:glycosyltransferase involved in cell wall biosynthesis